jgi:hypothetical protein
MTRRRTPTPGTDPALVDGALEALDAAGLRTVLREALRDLEPRARGQLVDVLMDHAARSGQGWAPPGRAGDAVAETLAFVTAARRAAHARPEDVDEHLRRGSLAFLGRDPITARKIFRAVLEPIGCGDIDLGQDEMVDEVLSVCVSDCVAQYVASVYLGTEPEQRAAAVRAALEEVDWAWYSGEPIRELERVAVEPLPDLVEFLGQWRDLLQAEAGGPRRPGRSAYVGAWLREVVRRMEGTEGLAVRARATRSEDDLEAWCQALVAARDWAAAVTAFDEAAELVLDPRRARGRFLDGAALAAQALGRDDLPARLERAWRAAPTQERLRRWLGAEGSGDEVKRRAAEALASCPEGAERQRSLLLVILGEVSAAAGLLVGAEGLGWSYPEHPGHLLVPVLRILLGGASMDERLDCGPQPRYSSTVDELEAAAADPGRSGLATPGVRELLVRVGVGRITDAVTRGHVLAALRQAAEHRLAGVVTEKHRHQYAHAAWLVAVCAALDPSPATSRWVEGLRAAHRRYPALRSELDRHASPIATR